MCTSRKTKGAFAGLAVVALAIACSAVSLGIPYWQNLDYDEITGNHGLFQYTVKSSGVETSGDYKNYLDGSDRTCLWIVRGLMIAGTSLLFLASIAVLVLLCSSGIKFGYIAAAACFGSAGVHIAAVVVFRIKLQGDGDSTYHAAFYLACVAAPVSVIAALLLLKSVDNGRNTTMLKQSLGMIGLLLTVLATSCTGVALGIPYWQKLDYDSIAGNHGLFRYTIETSGVESSGYYDTFLTGSDKHYLRAVWGLIISGAVFLLFAIIAILVFVCAKGWRSLGFVGSALCFLSAFMHVVGVVIFDTKLKGDGGSSYHAGFYLAIAAAVISFVSGILLLIAAARAGSKVTDSQKVERKTTNGSRSKKSSAKETRTKSTKAITAKVIDIRDLFPKKATPVKITATSIAVTNITDIEDDEVENDALNKSPVTVPRVVLVERPEPKGRPSRSSGLKGGDHILEQRRAAWERDFTFGMLR